MYYLYSYKAIKTHSLAQIMRHFSMSDFLHPILKLKLLISKLQTFRITVITEHFLIIFKKTAVK